MLSPNDIGRKAATPSIWSCDSGYVSASVCEERGGLLQLVCLIHSYLLRSRADGNQTQPQAGPSTSAYTLPEILLGTDTCIECEFWHITDPNFMCQSCRVPDVIEPATSMCGLSNAKALPRLDIPPGQTAQVEIAKTTARRPSKAHPSRNIGPASRCSACELSALIDPATATLCQSCSSDSSRPSPRSEKSPKYEVKRSRAGRNSKLPLSALNRLQAWLDANHHDPYPNAETKRLLAQECGITEKQVTTWFTNARARQLSPLDTYLSSSSEDEGARQSDIEEAAETSIRTAGLSYVPGPNTRVHGRRAASVSDASVFSNPQTHVRPSRRGKKKNYRRNAHPETPQTPLLLSPSSTTSPLNDSPQDGPDMWQCTFCRKSLVPKSWRRHEETQHRPKAQWTCMLYGPRLSFPARSNSSSVCAFCMAKNPAEDHFLTQHRIEDCARRDVDERTFLRPDHLRQHIKNFHNATLFEIAQARWKKAAETVPEGWTCGFCGERLDTWDKRESHIANHFKDGMTMAAWNEHSDNSPRADKKSRSRGFAALDRLSRHPFLRRSTRSSGPQAQEQLELQPPQPQPQPQPQSYIQNHPTTMHQQLHSDFSNPWTTADMASTLPLPPVLPDLPMLDPLMDMSNFGDWTLPANTDAELQYAMADTNLFDANPATTGTIAQQYQNSEMDMETYGNVVYGQGQWNQHHDYQQQNHLQQHRRR
jgi:hypothetical protein